MPKCLNKQRINRAIELAIFDELRSDQICERLGMSIKSVYATLRHYLIIVGYDKGLKAARKDKEQIRALLAAFLSE